MTPSSANTSVHWDRIWIGAELATMDANDDSIGHISNGALAIRDGRIAWLGTGEELRRMDWSADQTTHAHGLWITPGLIECHTHLVYAGDRAHEFESRLRGAGSPTSHCRRGHRLHGRVAQQTVEQLLEESSRRAWHLTREGVTTLEIKSGYGLDLAGELKMLRVGRMLGQRLGITVVNTFLGAHALPPEYTGRPDDYVRLVTTEMLPAAISGGLVDAVDAYHERIAFNRDQTSAIFEYARSRGLPVRLHADQLSDCGGGDLAAQHAALSADHLEYASTASLERMAAAGVVAGLLPGAFYYLREKQLPAVEHDAISRDRDGGIQRLQSRDVAARFTAAGDEHGVRAVSAYADRGLAGRDSQRRARNRFGRRSGNSAYGNAGGSGSLESAPSTAAVRRIRCTSASRSRRCRQIERNVLRSSGLRTSQSCRG